MAIVSTVVKVKWGTKTKKYYEERGYKYTKQGDEFEVKIEDLTESSHALVEIRCDYCKNTFSRPYVYHTGNRKRTKTDKDVCSECNGKNKVFPWTQSIDIARAEFEGGGLTLLETEYKDINTLMRYTCNKHSEHGEQETTLKVFRKRKHCCHFGYLEGMMGENSHLWKGGITDKNLLERHSYKFVAWRKAVFQRDNYICQACGDSSGGNLTAHHIENFSNNEDKRFDVDNGITLCASCHLPQIIGSFHYIYGTSENTQEQLDEYLTLKRSEKGIDITKIEIKRGGKRKRSKLAKLTDEQVKVIKQRIKAGETLAFIAKDYSVKPSLIQKIKAGRSYKHI